MNVTLCINGVRADFSFEDLDNLEQGKELHGTIYRVNRDGNTELPCTVSTHSDEYMVEPIPIDRPYEEKTEYKIFIYQPALEKIRNGRVIDVDTTSQKNLRCRKLWLMHEDVF